MSVLDSSVIIEYLDGDDRIVEYINVETTPPHFTPSLCLYEVLIGEVYTAGHTDLQDVRQQLNWIQSLECTEQIAIETAQIQHQLMATGDPLAPRDALIAGTARSTGDTLLICDSDFETAALSELLSVTTLEPRQ